MAALQKQIPSLRCGMTNKDEKQILRCAQNDKVAGDDGCIYGVAISFLRGTPARC